MQCARLKSAIKPVNLIGNATSSVFQLKTQALMGATRPASGKMQCLWLADSTNYTLMSLSLCLIPTRDASPPLVVAFCA